jgi:hypothetical protein
MNPRIRREEWALSRHGCKEWMTTTTRNG